MTEQSLQPETEKTTAFDSVEHEMAHLKRKYAILHTRMKVLANMFWLGTETPESKVTDMQRVAIQTVYDINELDYKHENMT